MTNEEFIQSISLEGEEWRDVVGYEGYYMISSYGRLLSSARTVKRNNKGDLPISPHLMKLVTSSHNGIDYNYTQLLRNNHRKNVGIHRLVAQAFLPNPNSYSDVDHIDRNGLNNHVSNLRWCSRSLNMLNENTRKVISASQHKKTLPTLRKPIVQLKNDVLINTYNSISEAETKYGYSAAQIVGVCKGRGKTHKGYKWMYLSDYESLTNKSKNSLPAPITAD